MNQKAKFSKLTEEELKKALHSMNVPTVNIPIMLDEMERSEEDLPEF